MFEIEPYLLFIFGYIAPSDNRKSNTVLLTKFSSVVNYNLSAYYSANTPWQVQVSKFDNHQVTWYDTHGATHQGNYENSTYNWICIGL